MKFNRESTHVKDLFAIPARDWTFFIRLLSEGTSFSYTKINHGFWESIINSRHIPIDASEEDRRAADRIIKRRAFLETRFREEMLDTIKNFDCSIRPHKYLAVSPFAFPGSPHLSGWPFQEKTVIQCIKDLLPECSVHDGLTWKWMTIEHGLSPLAVACRARHILCVGPSHLENLRYWFRDSFELFEIPKWIAREQRYVILESLREILEELSPEVIVLFQAGSLAPWLIDRLDRLGTKQTLLDLGRILDLADPSTIGTQPWFQFHSGTMAEHVKPARFPREDWHRQLSSFIDYPEYHIEPYQLTEESPIKFLENKRPNTSLIMRLLEHSEKANHWANSGPLSLQLETTIGNMLKLPPSHCVIVTSSGTSGLCVLTAIHEIKNGNPITWAIPSYTFPASAIAARGGALFLDVDERGLLDIDSLKRRADFSGIIVTNLFGLGLDLEPYIALSKERNIPLLIDNATGLDGTREGFTQSHGEMISFHHTKPWGFGEGGCIVVKKEDEQLARSIINFGVGGNYPEHLVFNAKMSEIAAAGVLSRLFQMPRWKPHYQWQCWRIALAASKLGFQPLFPTSPTQFRPDTTHAHVPLLAKFQVSKDQLNYMPIVSRKYYKPLVSTPVANKLFDHILCVPCHPGLAQYSNEDLMGIFEQIRSIIQA